MVAGVRVVMPGFGPGRVGKPRARSRAGASSARVRAFVGRRPCAARSCGVRAPAPPNHPQGPRPMYFAAKLPIEAPPSAHKHRGDAYVASAARGAEVCCVLHAGGRVVALRLCARSLACWLGGSVGRWVAGWLARWTACWRGAACHPRRRVIGVGLRPAPRDRRRPDRQRGGRVSGLGRDLTGGESATPATLRRQHPVRRHANPNPSRAPPRARAVSVPRDRRTRAGRNGGESATGRPEASTARSLAPVRNVKLTVVAHS